MKDKSKKNSKDELKFEIKKIYGYLNDEKNKIVADVSWNGRAETLDIRRCWITDAGEIGLGKGISLAKIEVSTLKELLPEVKTPVSFDDVFREAPGIVQKRDQGFTTEDGFIKLIPRKR